LGNGIISYGLHIPRFRIKREEYQRVWGYFSPRGVEEKSVADFDEDSVTMGVEAASNALRNARINESEIDAICFASTSPPYAEKQNASTIGAALGCRSDTVTLDLTSSPKSSVSALLSCLDLTSSGRGSTGLVVAADCPLADPSTPLEHQLGAAGAAMVVGSQRVGAVFDGSYSVTMESIGERFRRDGESHLTRVDLGAYHETILEEAVSSCVSGMMRKLNRSPKDYDFVALQGIEDAKALELSKKFGFEDKKATASLISAKIGDVGAASPLLALSRILESASTGQRVLLCSYGPGAGADAAGFVVEQEMKPGAGIAYEDYLARKEYIDYTTYVKLRRSLGKG
jgi:hydroxymethylglutaryl-CoA synthase